MIPKKHPGKDEVVIMRSIQKLRFSLLLTGLGLAFPLLAQNAVQNGQFETSLGRWTRYGGGTVETAWASLDAGSLLDSGSASLNEISTSPSTSGGLQQCVPVSQGATYLAAAKSWVDPQPTSGNVGLLVAWYTSFDCATGRVSEASRSLTPPASSWTTVSLPDLTPPGNARRALLQMYVFKGGAAGTYKAFFDDVVLMPTSAKLIVPASASIHGAAGTFFQTDLWVMNHSSSKTATVTARHRCFASQTCGSGTRTLTLPPRGTLLLTDAIGSFFGDPESSGAIELVYDPTNAAIAALSRTYTPSFPAPTFGTSIPALPSDEADTRSLFLGLGSNGGDLSSGFRSNAGAYNPTPDPVTVTFTLYGEDGAQLGSPFTRTLGPFEPYQTNVFRDTGNASVVTRNAYLVVTATSPVFAYVTVNDNQSGDQIYLRGSGDRPPI